MGWPSGEAAACKAVYAGSIPVPTSHRPQGRAARVIGAAVARFPDTEEVTGSIPVSRTSLGSNADVAQLARASPCHGEGREFESRHPLSVCPGGGENPARLYAPEVRNPQSPQRPRASSDPTRLNRISARLRGPTAPEGPATLPPLMFRSGSRGRGTWSICASAALEGPMTPRPSHCCRKSHRYRGLQSRYRWDVWGLGDVRALSHRPNRGPLVTVSKDVTLGVFGFRASSFFMAL